VETIQKENKIQIPPKSHLFYWLDFVDFSFTRNINGMANGPKTAPTIAQNLVFNPLLLAMCQRRNAHDIVTMEIIINPVMSHFLHCLPIIHRPQIN
jgi:hypothetical protein